MVGFKEFVLKIDDFVDDSTGRFGQIRDLLALQALTRLVLQTPVGNPELWEVNRQRKAAGLPLYAPDGYVGGTARANWQVTLRVPAVTPTADTDPAGPGTIAKGQARIGIAKTFDTIWITNTVPYIQRLNEGHSTQTPAKFFERTLLDLESQFR